MGDYDDQLYDAAAELTARTKAIQAAAYEVPADLRGFDDSRDSRTWLIATQTQARRSEIEAVAARAQLVADRLRDLAEAVGCDDDVERLAEAWRQRQATPPLG